MRDKYLWLFLCFSWIFFVVSMIVFCVGLGLLIPSEIGLLRSKEGSFVGLMILLAFFGALSYVAILANVYNESNMVRGNTKEIYKSKKKLKKLELKKEYLSTRKSNNERSQSLKCQIKTLELELKGQLIICEECGQKNVMDACYCSKCGNYLKERSGVGVVV